MNLVNFLIEENYAETPEAASKILEAASDQFRHHILQEAKKKSLLKKIGKAALKKVLRSKPVKAVKKFVGYTTLGMLPLP